MFRKKIKNVKNRKTWEEIKIVYKRVIKMLQKLRSVQLLCSRTALFSLQVCNTHLVKYLQYGLCNKSKSIKKTLPRHRIYSVSRLIFHIHTLSM